MSFGHGNQTTDGDTEMNVLSLASKTVLTVKEHA
jgi:hypothetical protein